MLERVHDLTLAGATATQIADDLNISVGYVGKLKRRINVKSPNPAGRPSPEYEWDKAEDMLIDGASYRDVAETFGIPRTTLTDNLPGYGWTAQEGGQWGYTLVQRTPIDLRKSLIRKGRND